MSNSNISSDLNHVRHKLVLGDGLDDHGIQSMKVMVCHDQFSMDQPVSDETHSFPSSSEDINCEEMSQIYYQSVNIEEVNRDHSTCHHCGEDLTNRRFYNHLFDHHGYTKQQLDIMKANKRIQMCRKRAGKKRKLEIFICDCGSEFASKLGLMNHKQRVHGDPKEIANGNDNIVCPSYGCEMSFVTYIDLAIHVDANHRNLVNSSDAFRIRRVVLPNKQSFFKWKSDMEKQTRSEFFLRTTQRVSFALKTSLYKCLFSNSRGRPKGRRCEQCPAFIRTCERNSGKFEVVGCFGHLGHEHDSETDEARELREIKWREIENLQKTEELEIQPAESVHDIEGDEITETPNEDDRSVIVGEGSSKEMAVASTSTLPTKRHRLFAAVSPKQVMSSPLDEDLE